MKYWIWLSQIKGVGVITQKKLLAYFASPEIIYHATKKQLMKVEGIGSLLEETIKATSKDPLYPTKAKIHAEAPILLYYRGVLRENSMGVGIVGARRCSTYGKEVARGAASFLAKNNIPVISDMAKGIDGYAHIACLREGGYTLAFLGNGVDICYPKEHDGLMEKIIEKGAVLSAYPPGAKPKPEYFPKRNALISAWSEKLLVVEAGEKSGALITAQWSKKLKRQVLGVPNEIYSKLGKGTNDLIASGATIYLKPEQLIIEENEGITDNLLTKRDGVIVPEKREKKKTIKEVKLYTLEEQKVIDLLQKRSSTTEEIKASLDIREMQLIEILTMLELEGVVKNLAGGKWGLV